MASSSQKRERASRATPRHRRRDGTALVAREYQDFVIHARRRSLRDIEVQVLASPVGQTKALRVAFSAKEARTIRESFRISLAGDVTGRMRISQSDAAELGRRLAGVLLPGPVVSLLGQSLAKVLPRENAGLRLRLAFSDDLNDLPWEYLYRPDWSEREGLSSFLLLDPRISLVREDAHPRIALQPIDGPQRLAFIGTLWEGSADPWEVRREYAELERALAPVKSYVTTDFTKASNARAFDFGRTRELAMFHYAGHCDFERDGRAFLVREMPQKGALSTAGRFYLDDLAPRLRKARTRLVVMSACNSGFRQAIKPLLDADIPAIVGINGSVASISTIEFCAKLYESLAVGLTIDEALSRARLHVLEWGRQYGLFDWGLYMAYMPSPDAGLFGRPASRIIAARQHAVRKKFDATVTQAATHARTTDGMNFSEVVTEMTKRRVLILGRFIGRRLKVLEAIKTRLQEHPNGYIPELFTYARPELRDLKESALAFASLSRFVIADLSEAKSVQSELESIVMNLLSVPVAPVISLGSREFALFSSLQRHDNVVKPTFRYRNVDHLLNNLDLQIIRSAEDRLQSVRPVE